MKSKKIGEKHYLVSGHANVEKFFEMIDYDMETDVFTVSGWVVETIGHLPKKGETYSNSTFEIEIREIDGKRIKKSSHQRYQSNQRKRQRLVMN